MAKVHWTPLVATPPYPTYAGNASGQSMAFATILAQFSGRDDVQVTVNFSSPDATRSYPGITAIADEMARSRVYGGYISHSITPQSNRWVEMSRIIFIRIT